MPTRKPPKHYLQRAKIEPAKNQANTMQQTGFRNLGFAWGVRSGPKGAVIDLPIFGFEGHNPYPVRANTTKQLGFRNLGFALGVCSGPKGPVID